MNNLLTKQQHNHRSFKQLPQKVPLYSRAHFSFKRCLQATAKCTGTRTCTKNRSRCGKSVVHPNWAASHKSSSMIHQRWRRGYLPPAEPWLQQKNVLAHSPRTFKDPHFGLCNPRPDLKHIESGGTNTEGNSPQVRVVARRAPVLEPNWTQLLAVFQVSRVVLFSQQVHAR